MEFRLRINRLLCDRRQSSLALKQWKIVAAVVACTQLSLLRNAHSYTVPSVLYTVQCIFV